MAAFAIVAALAAAGCTKGREPYPNQAKDAAPPKADQAAAKIVDAALPPSMAPPPAGAPQKPADFQRLSDDAQAGRQAQKPGAPPIERIDANRVRVGKVLVDRAQHQLEIPAQVNMVEGILEYFVVASEGKLHESVLEAFAEPSHVHLGLILLGLETAKWDRSDPMKMPTLIKRGSDLDLFVEYVDPKTKETRRQRGESWLYNRKRKGSPGPLSWHFHGSTFWNGRYTADSDRSLLALVPDETAVILMDGEFGNPYQGDQLGFEVYKDVIPPKDTAVTLILRVKDAVKVDPKGRTLPGSKLPMLAPRPIAPASVPAAAPSKP
ncbi:MAG: hypothetical protein KC613_10455 [Myxococcales bacterium]|nr:hypothetical protein [Myxococcales bacterium]